MNLVLEINNNIDYRINSQRYDYEESKFTSPDLCTIGLLQTHVFLPSVFMIFLIFFLFLAWCFKFILPVYGSAFMLAHNLFITTLLLLLLSLLVVVL